MISLSHTTAATRRSFLAACHSKRQPPKLQGLTKGWAIKVHARSFLRGEEIRISKRLMVVVSMAALSACRPVVLNPKGPVGAAETSILYGALAIMLVIIAPTIVATLGFAWWFRASNSRATYRPEFAYSGRIELVTWSIPTLTILLLGGVIWIGSHDLDPATPLRSQAKPLEVEVVSLDWKWLFIYPDEGIATVNQLVVPAGVPVHFRLTSSSVMSAFFVPQLGSMIYTMNGMTTQLNLMADKPGEFFGLSSHFNGDGFPGMHFTMRAVPAGDYANWIVAARASGPVLDKTTYRALSRQSMNVKPGVFSAATPRLFQDIVQQKLPPGAGPPATAMAPVARRQGAQLAIR